MQHDFWVREAQDSVLQVAAEAWQRLPAIAAEKKESEVEVPALAVEREGVEGWWGLEEAVAEEKHSPSHPVPAVQEEVWG